MAKALHGVQCRVFIKPGDDAATVKAAFTRFFPFPLEENNMALVTERVQGFDATIEVLKVGLDKQRLVRLFFNNFISLLSDDDLKAIVDQKESRLDEDGFFYMRLDKKAWLQGRAKLTDSGDCFHFTFEIAAYPKKRDVMLATVGKIFNRQPREQML